MSAVTEASQNDELLVRLKSLKGEPLGEPVTAPDQVNQAMIRHWVEAMGDENPVYVDAQAARSNGFPGVVAPPTMLQAWVMRGYRATAALAAERAKKASTGEPSEAVRSIQEELQSLLDAAGFTSVVATNCEQSYFRPLVLGDRLTARSVVEAVSERKTTALGEGHFVTTRTDFTDERGEPVATMTFRVLRFRPRSPGQDAKSAPSPAPSPTARRPGPALTPDNAFFFEGASEGKLLVQRCSECSTLRHPPGPACARCGSFGWDTVECTGRGILYSYVVVHHPQVPGFGYPLAIGLVELSEGTRLVADLVGVDPAGLSIGMDLVCEFVAVDDDLTLPMFRPSPQRTS